MLEDVKIGACEPSFLDCREKRLLVHRVAAPDVDDDALLRKASDKPRIEKIIRAGVGGKREDKPVGTPEERPRIPQRQISVAGDSMALDAERLEPRGDRAADAPEAGDDRRSAPRGRRSARRGPSEAT